MADRVAHWRRSDSTITPASIAPGWLLGGHAVRRVGAAELSALDAALGSLPGGWQAQVRAACGSGLPVDPDDALRALRDAVETASGAGHEVLVVVFPA